MYVQCIMQAWFRYFNDIDNTDDPPNLSRLSSMKCLYWSLGSFRIPAGSIHASTWQLIHLVRFWKHGFLPVAAPRAQSLNGDPSKAADLSFLPRAGRCIRLMVGLTALGYDLPTYQPTAAPGEEGKIWPAPHAEGKTSHIHPFPTLTFCN